jgi:hypothetical protein
MHLGGAHDGRRAAGGPFAFAWKEASHSMLTGRSERTKLGSDRAIWPSQPRRSWSLGQRPERPRNSPKAGRWSVSMGTGQGTASLSRRSLSPRCERPCPGPRRASSGRPTSVSRASGSDLLPPGEAKARCVARETLGRRPQRACRARLRGARNQAKGVMSGRPSPRRCRDLLGSGAALGRAGRSNRGA